MSEYLEKDWNERRIERRRQREKRLMAIYIGVFSAIAVLIYFKYYHSYFFLSLI